MGGDGRLRGEGSRAGGGRAERRRVAGRVSLERGAAFPPRKSRDHLDARDALPPRPPQTHLYDGGVVGMLRGALRELSVSLFDDWWRGRGASQPRPTSDAARQTWQPRVSSEGRSKDAPPSPQHPSAQRETDTRPARDVLCATGDDPRDAAARRAGDVQPTLLSPPLHRCLATRGASITCVHARMCVCVYGCGRGRE